MASLSVQLAKKEQGRSQWTWRFLHSCKGDDLPLLMDRSANSLRAEGCFEKQEKLRSATAFVKMLTKHKKKKPWQNSLPLFCFSCLCLKVDLLVLTFAELPGLVWQVSRRIKWTHTGSHTHTHTHFLSGLPEDLLSVEGQMKVSQE